MDRYEVMAGKMTPLTDGAHRKWGFAGKVETRSYERLVDALIDFVETGDGLKARFLTGITADELLIRNKTKVKWRCCKCGYEWITTIGHRAKRGTGCPRCNDKKTSQRKMKAVVCVETGKTYESITSAGRDVERTDGAICRALRNESQTCAGYHWKYLDE